MQRLVVRPMAFVLVAVYAPLAVAGEFVSRVHVYPRGETAEIGFKADGASEVRFDVSGLLPAAAPVVKGVATFSIDTALLRPGEYVVKAAPSAGEPAVFSLTVAPAHDAERIPVWRWGGGEGDPGWWRARGFTGGFTSSIRGPWNASAAAYWANVCERAALHDYELGLYISPLTAPALAEDESALTLLPDGTRTEEPYPLEPAVVAYAKEVTETWLANLHEYPALRHIMFHSEWQQPYAVNPAAIELARTETGLDIREFFAERWTLKPFDLTSIPDGIMPDDNPHYRIYQWWWQRGHGTAPLNEMLGAIAKAHKPDAITWHEPYRLAPVRYSHKGLDCIGTWTYGHPDIKRLCYTTYLQAAARPEKQLVQQDITLFLYGEFVVPIGKPTADTATDSSGGDPYFTAGPDYAREAIWLVMSQRPDILAFYSAGVLSPDNPALDPFISSPETFSAIGQTCEELVQPYGPAFRRAERVRPRTALLMSAAATWFNRGPSAAGYANEQTLPFATLMMMNHVPFDVLLDEDIAEGALENYDVLVMPRASTLLASVHERVAKFAQSGKKVIAQNPVPAGLPGVTLTDFDFTHQSRVDGKHLAQGNAVTAEEDRDIMEKYAAELSPLLQDVPRVASSESPRVLTNSLQAGQARYHFFVNDARTYGPRFGEHKLHFELGVPQTAGLSVALDGGPVLYDAMQRAPIEYEEEGGQARFSLRLPAARGKLVVQLPEAIGAVEVAAPASVKAGETVEIQVVVKGGSGNVIDAALPLKLMFTDPLNQQTTRYTATQGGRAAVKFTRAVNDPPGPWTVSVSELVAGKSGEVLMAQGT